MTQKLKERADCADRRREGAASRRSNLPRQGEQYKHLWAIRGPSFSSKWKWLVRELGAGRQIKKCRLARPLNSYFLSTNYTPGTVLIWESSTDKTPAPEPIS